MVGSDDQAPPGRREPDLRAVEQERRRLADADAHAGAEHEHEHERHEVELVRRELRRHDERLASNDDG
jgi:hypothetical protein